MNDDEQNLHLLSIFHYVVAGLVGLVACIPIIHLSIGLMFLLAPPQRTTPPGPGPQPEAVLGGFFVVIASTMILLGWSLAGCIAATGWLLSQRRRYMFCLVIACLECIWTPFGTILGVFTILVLQRPSVKLMFAEKTLPEALPTSTGHQIQAAE